MNEAARSRKSLPPAISSGPHTSGPNVRIVITTRMTARQTFSISLLAIVLLVLFASGCGSSDEGDLGGEPPDYEKALAGAPAPLAGLHEQANELLPGGTEAYEKRIAALRGYPVVVNVWASWCGPCRFEFPTLQKLSARYGKRVAFLGVDAEDSSEEAARFLEEEPVPYPSYSDPDKDIANSLDASFGLPNTAFYDAEGELVFLRQGPYAEDSELEADVRRYALDSG
jgi:cytochrome c biogenesis protein CcmG, thiol:disulfide interchange protein DsbE